MHLQIPGTRPRARPRSTQLPQQMFSAASAANLAMPKLRRGWSPSQRPQQKPCAADFLNKEMLAQQLNWTQPHRQYVASYPKQAATCHCTDQAETPRPLTSFYLVFETAATLPSTPRTLAWAWKALRPLAPFRHPGRKIAHHKKSSDANDEELSNWRSWTSRLAQHRDQQRRRRY